MWMWGWISLAWPCEPAELRVTLAPDRGELLALDGFVAYAADASVADHGLFYADGEGIPIETETTTLVGRYPFGVPDLPPHDVRVLVPSSPLTPGETVFLAPLSDPTLRLDAWEVGEGAAVPGPGVVAARALETERPVDGGFCGPNRSFSRVVFDMCGPGVLYGWSFAEEPPEPRDLFDDPTLDGLSDAAVLVSDGQDVEPGDVRSVWIGGFGPTGEFLGWIGPERFEMPRRGYVVFESRPDATEGECPSDDGWTGTALQCTRPLFGDVTCRDVPVAEAYSGCHTAGGPGGWGLLGLALVGGLVGGRRQTIGAAARRRRT